MNLGKQFPKQRMEVDFLQRKEGIQVKTLPFSSWNNTRLSAGPQCVSVRSAETGVTSTLDPRNFFLCFPQAIFLILFHYM